MNIHSADVQMEMLIGSLRLPLAQLGPDFVIFARPSPAQPPGPAEIILEIDGVPDRFTVHLPAGLASGEKRAAISHL